MQSEFRDGDCGVLQAEKKERQSNKRISSGVLAYNPLT